MKITAATLGVFVAYFSNPFLEQHVTAFVPSNGVVKQPSRLQPSQSKQIAASSSLLLSTITTNGANQQVGYFEPDRNGIYTIENSDEHTAFLQANPDKIVVLKFYAPWCRACKGLEPKFVQIANDPKYKDLPMAFCQMSVQGNKDYIKSLGVVALPSVLIYTGIEGLTENFPCGPSKVPILKKKLANVINNKIDPNTYKLMVLAPSLEVDCTQENMEAEPCTERQISGEGFETKVMVGDVIVSDESMSFLRNEIPFFSDFNDPEFSEMMNKARYVTFEAGDIIMRQGQPGRTFFVIDSGEVEISVKSAFEDPLTTPPSYLGAVINVLTKQDYFGERSLITSQPRAASIRAIEKTRCFAFDQDDIPASSVLSGKRTATTERVAQVDDKYGVDYYDVNLIDNQFHNANVANQERGSVNKPGPIRGVDTDDDAFDDNFVERTTPQVGEIKVSGKDDMIISLLVRFKLLRLAARCFDFITHMSPSLNSVEEAKRRSVLASKLTQAQREEFTDVFKLIDVSGDGMISVIELQRALESIGEEHSDTELREMIHMADPLHTNDVISLDDFIGIMAEAEFYYLFKETFDALDTNNTGYVRAGVLDKVLCGMRDLISDDKKSIIDVEDKDILIDTESFSLMLLGAPM